MISPGEINKKLEDFLTKHDVVKTVEQHLSLTPLDSKIKELEYRIESKFEKLATELEKRVGEDDFKTIREDIERILLTKQVNVDQEKLDLRVVREIEEFCASLA